MKIGKKIRNNSKNSINLEEMRLSVPEQSVYKVGIFYFLLLMMGMAGSLACFYSSFPVPIDIFSVVIFTLIFGASFTAVFLMRRKNNWIVIGALAIVALLIFFFQKSFYRGLLVTIKCILDEFRAHGSGVAMPNALKENIKSISAKTDSTFFIICLIYILTMLISWLFIKRHNFFLSAFITLPFILAPILVPITPSFFAVIILIFYYFTLIFLSPSLSGNKVFKRSLRGYHISSTASANPIAFLILSIFLICVIIVSIIFPQSSYKRSPFLEAVRLSIANGFDSSDLSRYLNVTFGGNLDDIDLKGAGDISFNNLPVLGVTMLGDYYYYNSPHKIGDNHTEFLKGYVGSNYSDGGWKPLSKGQSDDVSNILGSDSAQKIYSQFKRDFGISSESYENFSLKVKYIRGDPRKVYIPYGLHEMVDESQFNYIDDGYVVSTNSEMGISEYSYNSYSIFDDSIKFSLDDRIKNYWEEINEINTDINSRQGGYLIQGEDGYIYYIGGNGERLERIEKFDPTKDYKELLDKYNKLYGYDKNNNENVNDILVKLSNYISPQQLEYIEKMKKYEKFVNENYTKLPTSTDTAMKKYISENGIRTDSMDNSIEDITNIFKDSGKYNYTLSPGKTPDKKDFAEYFLLENKKGYCRHFATAATLLLRSAGVPARYAEGYKIDSSRFATNNYVELLDSNAHAWVEVYYSGTGWVPIEVTPAVAFGNEGSSFESSEESSNVSSSIESSDTSSESNSSQNTVESSEIISNSNDASQASNSTSNTSNVENESNFNTAPIIFIVFIPICGISIFAILVLNRFIRIRNRKKHFADINKNRATLAVYKYILKLLLYKTNYTDYDSELESMSEIFDSDSKLLLHRKWYNYFCNEIYPIAQRAKFSGKNITDDEFKVLSESAESIRTELIERLNIMQKFVAIYFDII